MDRIIYGADTETVEGEPNTLQFYSEDVSCSDIYFVTPKTALKTFLQWCSRRKPKQEHVVYVHNLKFDLPEFLYGIHSKLVEDGGDFHFSVNEWDVSGVHGTPTFAKFTNRRKSITVLLIDSFSFYRGSLAEASKLYCPDLPKLSRPKNLGQVAITKKDTSKIAYAMRDAEVSYHIGKAIDALHKEFDLKQCVSVADLSARVFRHRFLSYTIPQPTDDVILASLDSYHGGKNNITVDPGWYLNTTSLDISSAYPAAMHEMPSFANGKLYKRFKGTARVKKVPPWGVYCVSGKVDTCKWPCLFDHDFSPLSGKFDRIHIAGCELNEALASGELHLSRISGWYYDAEKDIQAPALRNFVEDFYRRKETEKDKVRRFGYKLILNSLYGKFIQTRKKSLKCYVNIDSGKMTETSELVAGGMFHPFIASAITANTRAKIHKLEHHYKAIHTATDGIFTQHPKAAKIGKASGLGSVGCDVRGDLLLIRNKLYVIYGNKETKDSTPSRAFAGKHIYKYAKHGFQGSVFDLERLIATNKRKYTANHVNQLKESMNRGLQVNQFVKREYNLRVGTLKVQS